MKSNNNKPPVQTSLTMVRRYFPNVTNVVDADKSVVVEVTKKDAAAARRKNPRACALALCLERTFKADGVIIGLTVSWVIKDKTATRFANAETISREVTSFDRFGPVGFDAGFYNLAPISPSNRLGAVQGGKKKTETGTGKPKKIRHYTQGVRVLGID